MAKNVLITPANGDLEFRNINNELSARFQLNDNGDLLITSSYSVRAFGVEVLNGLGNTQSDFQIFQEALNRTASEGKCVYIPSDQHLRLTDFPIFPDNAILINDGIYENVTTNEDYPFKGCLFGLGRITQSDFWPDPNYINDLSGVTQSRIIINDVSIGTQSFYEYNNKNGTKQSRVFYKYQGSEYNPGGLTVSYVKQVGNDGNNFYIDIKDKYDNDLMVNDLAEGVYIMDTIGLNSGFLNQEGINVFDLNPARRGKVVTLLTSGAGASFSVGEKVFLKSKGNYIARFSSDRAFTPYYSHPDIVEAISGDTVTLSIGVHDLGVELNDLQLCKFTNLRAVSTEHPSGGISPNCVRNVYIGGKGRFIQNVNRSAIAYAGGCMIDVKIDVQSIEGAGFTTNCFARSTAKINKLESTNAAVSLALGSCDFSVEIGECSLIKATGEGSSKDSRSVVFPHENIVNGSVKFNSPIRISNDYPLAINLLEMDCMRVDVDMSFEVDKNNQGVTPSFGNCIQVRSQDPQVLGDSRGYHGQNTVKVVGSSPYVAQVIGFDDAIDDYLESPSIYDVNFRGAFGSGLVMGENRNNNDITFNFDRFRRVLNISDIDSDGNDKTILTFSSGDTRSFADGQSVKFENIVSDNWNILNNNSYIISSIESDSSIKIDFDSSTFSSYTYSENAIMYGNESLSFIDFDSTSYLNNVNGYCYNGVDVSTVGKVWNLGGLNNFKIEDHKSRQLNGLVSSRNLTNTYNGSTFSNRPDSGYTMMTSGIEIKISDEGVTYSNYRYPSLNRFGKFDYLQKTSISGLLDTTDNLLKPGDTFTKTIKGRIYGTYSGKKILLDSYRWGESNDNFFKDFIFETNINNGNYFTMTTDIEFSTANYITTYSTFHDGFVEQRLADSKKISIPTINLRNHFMVYFDDDFQPEGNTYSKMSEVISYEQSFTGEELGNNINVIYIESVDFGYKRKK